MVSQGMGNLTTGKLDEIRSNENTVVFLTKIDASFYTAAAKLLNSMMTQRNTAVGELREGLADKTRYVLKAINDITYRRIRKLGDMAIEEVFNQHKPDLAQATPEEREMYRTFRTTIRGFVEKGRLVE